MSERNRQPRSETVYTCEICAKSFAYKNLLKNHRALHGDDGKDVFKCNCCPLRFVDTKEMHAHLYEEHIDELKCTYDGCVKIFDYPIRLKKHIKFAHSEDTKKTVKKADFVCALCGMVQIV